MTRNKTPRLAPQAYRTSAASGSPAIVDGLFADPCWPDSTGNTRCVLCSKAIATGASRNNALVAVSTGLLESMTEEEVAGVLGHEVAHVANGEVWEQRDVLGRSLWFPKDRL